MGCKLIGVRVSSTQVTLPYDSRSYRGNALIQTIKVVARIILLGIGVLIVLLITDYYGIGLRSFFAPPSLVAATRKLPTVSKIEIYRFADGAESFAVDKPSDPASPDLFLMSSTVHNKTEYLQTAGVTNRVTLVGEEAEALASIWRDLGFGNMFSAFCHLPAYGLHMQTVDGRVFSATLCWGCGNLALGDAAGSGMYDFRSYAGNGRKLRLELDRLTSSASSSSQVSAP